MSNLGDIVTELLQGCNCLVCRGGHYRHLVGRVVAITVGDAVGADLIEVHRDGESGELVEGATAGSLVDQFGLAWGWLGKDLTS